MFAFRHPVSTLILSVVGAGFVCVRAHASASSSADGVSHRGAKTPRRVIVIGGGVCGLMTAWFLRQRGHDVCVLERDHVGSPYQASAINSGFLSNASSAIDLSAEELAVTSPGQYALNEILCAGSISIYEQLQQLAGFSLGVRRTATIEVLHVAH